MDPSRLTGEVRARLEQALADAHRMLADDDARARAAAFSAPTDGARLVELEARLVEQGAELDRLRSQLVAVTTERDEALTRAEELRSLLAAVTSERDALNEAAVEECSVLLARVERAEGEGARCRATMADATAAAHRKGWGDCLAAVRRALDVHNYPGV